MHLDQTGSSDKLKKIMILKSLSSFYLQIAQSQDPLLWNQTLNTSMRVSLGGR